MLALASAATGVPRPTAAAAPPGLIEGLRKGGYVIVMRHAASPRDPPAAGAVEAGNTNRERQLDEAGKRSSAAFGQALKQLGVPVTRVLSSPTFRAQQTVRLAGLPAPELRAELGDGGASMQAASADKGEWLRRLTAEPPRSGDVLVVTHLPNLREAFGAQAAGAEDGEALIFRPAGKGPPVLAGRIKIEEWAELR
jgi:phosphohistidine phosphatase SixA